MLIIGAMTNFFENKIVDFIFRGQALSLPLSFYVALFTTPPSDAGGGTEVDGGGYTRVSIPRSLEAWAGTQEALSIEPSEGTSGTTYNNLPIQFPEATATWGTITHFALLDAETGGNMLFWGELGMPRSIYAGDSPTTFLPSDMSYQIDT